MEIGTLIEMRECVFDQMLPGIVETKTGFPRILKTIDDDLKSHIMDGSFYGFVECDLWISDERIDEIKWINFPPIISKRQITTDHLSNYMKARFETENRRLDQESLVQTYRGTNLFVFSPLLKFYFELGYEMKNVKMATQYLGQRCFKPFIDKVVEMRIRATYEGDETKVRKLLKINFDPQITLNII